MCLDAELVTHLPFGQRKAPLPHPLQHAHLFFPAEPGGTLVRTDYPAGHPSRQLPQRPRSGHPHQTSSSSTTTANAAHFPGQHDFGILVWPSGGN